MIVRDKTGPYQGLMPGYSLVLFWIIYVVHQIDRSIILILVEPIRVEFNLDDTQVGLVSGMAFAIAYVLCGIPLGMLADKVHRVRMLAVLIVLWSAFTFAGGLVNGLALLLLTRLLAGAAEAGASPVMLSMLSDTFRPRSRPAIFSFFYTAPLVGAVGGAVIGGYFAGLYGWRAALFIAGVPGVVLALVLLLTICEPERGRFDDDARPQPVSLSAVLEGFRHSPMLRHLFLIVILFSLIFTSISAWFPIMLMRKLGFPIAQAGWITALAVSLPGGLGSLVGGFIAQRIGQETPRPVIWMCAGAALIALPLGLLGLFVDNRVAVIGLFTVWAFLSWMYLGPCYGLYVNLSSANLRATLIAVLTTASAFAGIGVGPQLVGLLSDGFATEFGTASGLSLAIATLLVATLVPIALLIRAGLGSALAAAPISTPTRVN